MTDQIATPTEQDDFAGYPEGQVLGIFDARHAAAAALSDFKDSGFAPADLHVYSGPEGEHDIDADGTEHGMAGVTRRAIATLLTDQDHLGRYGEAVHNGGIVVGVEAPNDGTRQTAAAIFVRHGGYDVYSFGSMAVQKLDVDPSRTRMGGDAGSGDRPLDTGRQSETNTPREASDSQASVSPTEGA